jgi:hypothetical protein
MAKSITALELQWDEQAKQLAEEEARALKAAKAKQTGGLGRPTPKPVEVKMESIESQPQPGLGRPPVEKPTGGVFSAEELRRKNLGVKPAPSGPPSVAGRGMGAGGVTLAALGSMLAERGIDAYKNVKEEDLANEWKAAEQDSAKRRTPEHQAKLTAAQQRVQTGQGPNANDLQKGAPRSVTVLPGVETTSPQGASEDVNDSPIRAVIPKAIEPLKKSSERRAARRAARQSPEDQALATLEPTPAGEQDEFESLQNLPLRVPRVQEDKAASGRVEEMSKNRTERPEKKGGILRSLHKVAVAMDPRGFDMNRLDNQEADAYQKQNAMTEREKFGAGAAADKANFVQSQNRDAQLKDYGVELGLNVAQQEEQRNIRKEGRTSAARSAEQMTEAGYASDLEAQKGQQRLEELKQSAAMQKVLQQLDPELGLAAAQRKFANDNPYADPELTLRVLQAKLSPEAVKAYRLGLQKGTLSEEQIQAFRNQLPSSGQAANKNAGRQVNPKAGS